MLNIPSLGIVPMTQTKVWFSIIAITGILALGVAVAPPMAVADKKGDSEIPQIKDVSVKVKKKHLDVKIKTDSKIPKNGKAGLFGYGVLTDGTNNVLAVTTHICASDSPYQGNAKNKTCPDDDAFGLLQALTAGELLNKDFDGAKWHAHILDLKAADGLDLDNNGIIDGVAEETAGCGGIDGADFEVDLGGTTDGGNNVSPDYKLKVKGDTIKVKAPLGGTDVTPSGDGIAIATFGLGATTDGFGNINDLCLVNTILSGLD